MSQFFNSVKDVSKNYSKYDKWEQEQADEKAITEYEKFRPIQDANYISDFDRELEQLEKKLEKKGD